MRWRWRSPIGVSLNEAWGTPRYLLFLGARGPYPLLRLGLSLALATRDDLIYSYLWGLARIWHGFGTLPFGVSLLACLCLSITSAYLFYLIYLINLMNQPVNLLYLHQLSLIRQHKEQHQLLQQKLIEHQQQQVAQQLMERSRPPRVSSLSNRWNGGLS